VRAVAPELVVIRFRCASGLTRPIPCPPFCPFPPHALRFLCRRWLYFVRNVTLYSFGCFALLVYGLANAWLKRSLRMACDRVRLTDLCCLEDVQASYLKGTTDKHVSFHASVFEATRVRDTEDDSRVPSKE